jgi:pheromone shutdown-related protein TraB
MLKKLREGFLLVGVAHILPKSLQEVGEAIATERPEIVAVELDPFRYLALTQPETLVPPGKTKVKLSAVLLGGLMSLLQTKFSHQTGMPAGKEMLVAVEKAREVGADVRFIDQDIRLTLHRVNELMPFREKCWLMFQMLLSLFPFHRGPKLEKLTEEQVVDYLLKGFKQLSPTAYRVLIEERDSYMTSELIPLLESGKKVVCVVGAGHIPGLARRLEEALKRLEAEVWWKAEVGFETGW